MRFLYKKVYDKASHYIVLKMEVEDKTYGLKFEVVTSYESDCN